MKNVILNEEQKVEAMRIGTMMVLAKDMHSMHTISNAVGLSYEEGMNLICFYHEFTKYWYDIKESVMRKMKGRSWLNKIFK